MTTETYSLPARWAGYLINNDRDDVESTNEAKEWLAVNSDIAHCLSCSDHTYFAKTNDAFTIPSGGDCLDFTFAMIE